MLATGLFGALPLLLTGPMAFLVLRALAGLSAALYDPAARGYLTDATPEGKRGEAFGLYGAAQMGGLLLGPRDRRHRCRATSGASPSCSSSARSRPSSPPSPSRCASARRRVRTHPAPAPDSTEFRSEPPSIAGRAAADVDADRTRTAGPTTPTRLWNRGLIAAIVINAGGYFAGGTYEVIWSLFLQGLGADLALIGLTFAMFGLPVLVFSPIAGRIVDRRGSFAFIIVGSILPVAMGIVYTRITDPVMAVPLILIEATGFAFLNPALYAVVAANSPPGRSSTAQGLFGAAGTLGFIVASLGAGVLASQDIKLPFYVFAVVLSTCLVVGLIIGGPALRVRPARIEPAPT